MSAIKAALKKATVKIISSVEGTPDLDYQQEMDGRDELLESFFQLQPTELNKKTADKLALIREYATEVSGGDSEIDLLSALRDVRFKLGSPRANVSQLDHIFNYVKLRQQAKTLETQAQAMEQ